ncbi:MAG: hypothetical protein IJU44_13320 [Kiritimatiellae bacterium]|nr:hypothetical protein [Kiritimatiellia bacterium]
MKATNLILAGIALMSAVAFGQAPQVVAETEKLDPQTSADLKAFKARVAAANPGLDVVKVEADVVRRAVLAPPPPPPAKTPVMAIFVKNHTKTAGMDDQVDGIRDRLAAEMSGMDFVIMDSAEIGAAFNRYKITTAEERAGLIDGLFTGGSVTRVAQMLGADYILTASIIGASEMQRVAGDREVTIYTLRMATKVLDATTGGSIYGKNWNNKRPVPKNNGDDPMGHYDDLIDMWVQDTGADLTAARPRWRAPVADAGELATFSVTTTIDATIAPLEATVDATKPVKDELRLVAGGITVEVDGAAIGSSGGTFRARPGLHQLRVSRQWMKPWVGTVNIADGAVFNVALELSDEGFRHYKNKEALRAEVALAYAEAAFRRGCRINFDTAAWQTVTLAPGADATGVFTETVVQPTVKEKAVR